MKSKFLITVLFVVLASYTYAQEPVTPDYAKAIGSVKFGLKGGVNFSTQNFDIDSGDEGFDLDTASLTAVHFGAFVDVPLSNTLSLRPELLYSVEGSKINLLITEFKQKFTFIKVPVLLSYRVVDQLSVQAGPQFGFLIDESLDVPSESADIFESAYKDFEFSAAIGLEYRITEAILVGARYNIGLTDMSDISGASLKNNNFQLYLGWVLFK